jgi:hypothetical protein
METTRPWLSIAENQALECAAAGPVAGPHPSVSPTEHQAIGRIFEKTLREVLAEDAAHASLRAEAAELAERLQPEPCRRTNSPSPNLQRFADDTANFPAEAESYPDATGTVEPLSVEIGPLAVIGLRDLEAADREREFLLALLIGAARLAAQSRLFVGAEGYRACFDCGAHTRIETLVHNAGCKSANVLSILDRLAVNATLRAARAAQQKLAVRG